MNHKPLFLFYLFSTLLTRVETFATIPPPRTRRGKPLHREISWAAPGSPTLPKRWLTLLPCTGYPGCPPHSGNGKAALPCPARLPGCPLTPGHGGAGCSTSCLGGRRPSRCPPAHLAKPGSPPEQGRQDALLVLTPPPPPAMKKLYFVHPETKGRIDLTLPKDKANTVAALLKAQD